MFRNHRIAVVVPAHNEARFIVKVIETLPSWIDEVIVVDDASSDRTLEALDTASAPCLVTKHRHCVNAGVGGAIVTGYKIALTRGHDIAVVMAADAQMDPADLPFLLDPIVRKQADYSKGDRLSWPGVRREMPMARYIGNTVLSFLSRWFCGYSQVRDSQCGYTAVTTKMLSLVDLDSVYPRYGFPNSLLTELRRCDARLAQVPVRPIYGDEISGISLFTALVRVPLVILGCGLRRLFKSPYCPALPPSRGGNDRAAGELP